MGEFWYELEVKNGLMQGFLGVSDENTFSCVSGAFENFCAGFDHGLVEWVTQGGYG